MKYLLHVNFFHGKLCITSYRVFHHSNLVIRIVTMACVVYIYIYISCGIQDDKMYFTDAFCNVLSWKSISALIYKYRLDKYSCPLCTWRAHGTMDQCAYWSRAILMSRPPSNYTLMAQSWIWITRQWIYRLSTVCGYSLGLSFVVLSCTVNIQLSAVLQYFQMSKF